MAGATHEQRALIERLAAMTWPGEVGQVIARRIVAVFHVSGEQLLYIDGAHAAEAAIAALRVLAVGATDCDHYWVETSRDTGGHDPDDPETDALPTINERCKQCGQARSRQANTLAQLLLEPSDDLPAGQST